jgi:hypothetical protein
MARDFNFDEKTKTRLRETVGAKCSNPFCRIPTIASNHSDSTKVFLNGDAAHILSGADGGRGARGPRYVEDKPLDYLKSFDNGIWLCKPCHNLVDRDSCYFTEAWLRHWKKTAIDFARKELNSQSINANGQYSIRDERNNGIEFWAMANDAITCLTNIPSPTISFGPGLFSLPESKVKIIRYFDKLYLSKYGTSPAPPHALLNCSWDIDCPDYSLCPQIRAGQENILFGFHRVNEDLCSLKTTVSFEENLIDNKLIYYKKPCLQEVLGGDSALWYSFQFKIYILNEQVKSFYETLSNIT